MKSRKSPISALQETDLSRFTIEERLRWAAGRETKRAEDRAYCLLGIFGIFMPLIYGEGDNAFRRLKEEIYKLSGKRQNVLVDTDETNCVRIGCVLV